MFVTQIQKAGETISYKHISITEREKILFHRAAVLSICQIAKILGRNKATISCELKRNPGGYSPGEAQTRQAFVS